MEPSWDNAVVLEFWTFQDPGGEDTGRLFLRCLNKFGFVPKKFDEDDPPKRSFNPSLPRDLLNLWVTHPGQLIIERPGQFGFEALLHLSMLPEGMPTLIDFALHDRYFSSRQNTTKFLEFSRELYEIFKPVQGDIAHGLDKKSKKFIEKSETIQGRLIQSKTQIPVNPTWGLPGIFWANFLGPAFVEHFSRQRIEAAPCFSRQALPDGGCLILTAESPLDYSKRESKLMERALGDVLGWDSIFDINNPDANLRSPFPAQGKRPTRKASRFPASVPIRGAQLRQCPECGETAKTDEISRDPVNNMVGFRCLKCGRVWAVESSLL